MALYDSNVIGKKTKEGRLEKFVVGRGHPSPDNVEIDIKYCGICHTDLHLANNDLGFTTYPMVPGHEVAGVVTSVGENIKDVKVGDHVGIGWYIDTCEKCNACKDSQENHCEKGNTATSCGPLLYGRISTDNGKYSYGGFSDKITAPRRCISVIPKSYPLHMAGPIFCGGITMYTPLKRFGALNGGLNIGVIGLGGLGQLGLRLASEMGNTVTGISTTPAKEKTAKELGATHFVVSKDDKSMEAAKGTLDLLLDTISAPHQINHYIPLMKRRGTIVLLGVGAEPQKLDQMTLIVTGVAITGSPNGGMQDTQECMNFFAEKNIEFNVSLVDTVEQVENVFDILHKGNDSIIRYIIDIQKCFKN